MRRGPPSACVAAALLLVPIAPCGAAGTPRACGELRGPLADYTAGMPPQRFRGTTWAAYPEGVSCAAVMKALPAVLKQWTPTRQSHFSVRGFYCFTSRREPGQKTSVGGWCERNLTEDVPGFTYAMVSPTTPAQYAALGLASS